MDASDPQIGVPEYTDSNFTSLNPGIILPSGLLCSTTRYQLPTPNAIFNSCDYGDYLSELREVSTGKRIFTTINPWVLECSIRSSKKVGQALLYVESKLWRSHERGRLKSAIRRCVDNYNDYTKSCRLKEFQDFWMNNPTYNGLFRGVTRKNVSFIGTIPLPPESYFVTELTQLRISNSFEKYLDLIVEWAMCCFSHRKNDWTFIDAEEMIVPDLTLPTIEDAVVTKKAQAKKQFSSKRKSATRRKIEVMMRKGILSQIAIEQLELDDD